MIVNTEQVLKTMDGKTMKDNDGSGNVIDATLKLAIVNALLAPTQKQDSGVDKIKKYELAKKVYNNVEVDLDEKEISLIKDCVNTAYPPLICGQVNDLLKI